MQDLSGPILRTVSPIFGGFKGIKPELVEPRGQDAESWVSSRHAHGLSQTYSRSFPFMDLMSSSCFPSTNKRPLSIAAFVWIAVVSGDGGAIGVSPVVAEGVSIDMSLGVGAGSSTWVYCKLSILVGL